MIRTKNYAPPTIIRESRIYSDTAILAGSVVDKAAVTIDAAQQKVENYNFGDSEFNHNWE
ncbi:MAG: hypothetical protein IJK32_09085 [Bacteroidales bacterium]|nr:hypothetical protein [Bacteroidales bacterium]